MLTVALLSTTAVPARASGPITEFPVPTANSIPTAIIVGPDGNMWFCESDTNKIARSTPDGVITEFDVSGPPIDIVAGADGNLWFTAANLDVGATLREVGRVSPSGTVTEFPLAAAPDQIAAGPDGNLWFTEAYSNSNEVGRISPGGMVTYFPLPSGHWSADITVGADGNLWLTEELKNGSAGLIGRMTTTGALTEFPLPTGSRPGSIAAGPDGNLWFMNFQSGATAATIDRITTGGAVTEFELTASALGRGPAGEIWFVNDVRVDTDMVSSISHLAIGADGVDADQTFPVPTLNAGVYGLSPGPDGNLWFTEAGANKIGRIDVCGPNRLCLGNRFEITATWSSGSSSGTGTAVPITSNAGYFWFSEPANVEVFAKILDNCQGSGKFNVYVNGLTHLGVTVTVTDMRSGTSRQFVNPDGAPFSLLFDGSTFACP